MKVCWGSFRYLLLLQRNTDRVGTALAAGAGARTDRLAGLRFALPVALVAALAARNQAAGSQV